MKLFFFWILLCCCCCGLAYANLINNPVSIQIIDAQRMDILISDDLFVKVANIFCCNNVNTECHEFKTFDLEGNIIRPKSGTKFPLIMFPKFRIVLDIYQANGQYLKSISLLARPILSSLSQNQKSPLDNNNNNDQVTIYGTTMTCTKRNLLLTLVGLGAICFGVVVILLGILYKRRKNRRDQDDPNALSSYKFNVIEEQEDNFSSSSYYARIARKLGHVED